jgi:flagellin-like protein
MKLENMFQDDNRGVSPVIGVILMVAITVILAAVIGTFVLGLGENVESNPSAGISVGSNNTVTLVSLSGNTEGIKCSNPSDENVTNIGGSINCNADSAVIAYSGDNEAVIRSNVSA